MIRRQPGTSLFIVRVFVFPGARLLDVIGPIEVFTSANDFGGLYRLQVVSEDGLDVITCAGTRLGAGLSVDDLREPCDVLMIPGGPEWERLIKDAVVDVMRGLNEKARCTAPVCTGAFLLAAAGLLDGHRATTHWGDSRQLALHFPAVQVESDAIFVRDGQMMTSAGVSAGIGLSLALVEEHYGAQVARAVAKDMVVFMQRPGGQSQFSVRYQAPHTRHEMIRQVLDAVVEDLAWLGGRRRHPSLTVAPPAGCGELGRPVSRGSARPGCASPTGPTGPPAGVPGPSMAAWLGLAWCRRPGRSPGWSTRWRSRTPGRSCTEHRSCARARRPASLATRPAAGACTASPSS